MGVRRRIFPDHAQSLRKGVATLFRKTEHERAAELDINEERSARIRRNPFRIRTKGMADIMEVRQCRKCRKLYQYNGNPLCIGCVEELDKLFNDVRNYLYDNPHANMDEVCAETGADSATVAAWLREGRLILSMGGANLIKCESCGDPIRSGRFCEKCAKNVKDQLESAAKAISQTNPPEQRSVDVRSGSHMHVDFKRK